MSQIHHTAVPNLTFLQAPMPAHAPLRATVLLPAAFCAATLLGLQPSALAAPPVPPTPAAASAAPPAKAERPLIQINVQESALPPQLRQIPHTGQMRLYVREGHLLQLPRAATKVLVADPTIANFQMPTPNNVFVFAQSVGSTTLYALDANDQVIAAVRVIAEHNLQALREQIARSVPGADVELEPSLNNRLIVRGKVRTPLEARQVVDQLQAYLDASRGTGGGGGGNTPGAANSAIVNQLKVELSSQVNIQVRVVEVSRSLSHELGFDWGAILSNSNSNVGFGIGSNSAALFDATNASAMLAGRTTGGGALGGISTRGNFTLRSLISALSDEGMATLLAEPNLTAMSGESAAFAAGGEVPIVIITNNNVQIDFKSYGVILRMTPTMLSPNRISLHIAPEVSELTEDGAVTLEGLSIPAFKVRRADTTVELASGQSFALAGMLRTSSAQSVSGVPGLKDVPLLGRAFEHERSERKETELVILVTASVVDPVAASDLQVPGQGLPQIDSNLPQQAPVGYLY